MGTDYIYFVICIMCFVAGLMVEKCNIFMRHN